MTTLGVLVDRRGYYLGVVVLEQRPRCGSDVIRKADGRIYKVDVVSIHTILSPSLEYVVIVVDK